MPRFPRMTPALLWVLVLPWSLSTAAVADRAAPSTVTAATAAEPAAEEADATTEPTVVILVRHAEKVTGTGGKDPKLTSVGRERAELLAQMLAGTDVAAVYSTPFHRTRDTAGPIAAALGKDIRTVKPDPEHPQRLARRMASEHAGETVLVVGHSNTIPAILEALGVEGLDAELLDPKGHLHESDYDNLFVVFLHGGGARLLPFVYGRPTR